MQRIMFSLERGGDTINNSETLLPSSPKPRCVLGWENDTKTSISQKPTNTAIVSSGAAERSALFSQLVRH